MSADSLTPNTRYKVGRVLSEYELDSLHEELADRWRGDGHEAQSLRELAEDINVALLRHAMTAAGLDPLDGEVENAYRLLRDDDVSAGERTQQRNRLEREGVHVEALEGDFVTHQAVHTYLTEALDVTKQVDGSDDPVETHDQRINRLRSRTAAVTRNSIETLSNQGELTVGDHDVMVDVRVYCHDCGSQYSIAELLDNGGCACPR